MTRVFLYEFVTAGGTWSLGDLPPSGTLLCEGRAMLQSLAEDLLACDDVKLNILADSRLEPFWPEACQTYAVTSCEQEEAQFYQLAQDCDVSLIVAPEFNDLLLSRARWVEQSGGTLGSPDARFIKLTADKQQLADYLAAGGIPVPQGVSAGDGKRPPADFPYPAVLKPNDGAGSQNVHLVHEDAEACALLTAGKDWRLERFQAGAPASVAILCGPKNSLVLPPARQQLSTDGRFTFLGCTWPLDRSQQRRAAALAEQVIAVLPATRGYVGIDLVLGAEDDGSGDVVIEVNPRLTTSYAGLRCISATNLAGAMLQVAAGRPAMVSWRTDSFSFQVSDMSPGARPCPG